MTFDVSIPAIVVLYSGDAYKGLRVLDSWQVLRYDDNRNVAPTPLDWSEVPSFVQHELEHGYQRAHAAAQIPQPSSEDLDPNDPFFHS